MSQRPSSDSVRRLGVWFVRAPDDDVRVGTLAEADRRIYFEYDAAFLGLGLELSPFRLPTRPGVTEHRDLSFGPLPGLFDDSLPDGWGRLLMDRACRDRGIEPAALSPLDRLAYVGNRAIGALAYRPADELDTSDAQVDLAVLGRNARSILMGRAVDVLPALLRVGGSAAGARPKALVGMSDASDDLLPGDVDLPPGYAHWIVKFIVRPDARDAAAVEHAYALLARQAGIDVPVTRVIPLGGRGMTPCFATRRFDRAPGNRRFHIHTLANLLHSDFRRPSLDYADLLRVTNALTRDDRELAQAFARMAFNVVMHNRDDHGKNFAFRMEPGGRWRLAPAYDLTFSFGPGGEHFTTVLGEGAAPTRAMCLRLAAQANLERDAPTILDRINDAASRWKTIAREVGVQKTSVAAIAKKIRPL